MSIVFFKRGKAIESRKFVQKTHGMAKQEVVTDVCAQKFID
jgi:hypothetical protein